MHATMILVDFHKVSDTLDQGVRLEKMKYFLFQTPVIKWFDNVDNAGVLLFLLFYM